MCVLNKILHLLQRFGGCCKVLPGNIREFGLKVAFLQFWDVLIPTGKSKKYIETLSKYVIKDLEPVTQRYNNGEVSPAVPKQKLDKIPVWVCWWQGEESMPPIVKSCVAQMRCVLPQNAQLHIITWDNLPDYVELPGHILEKYENGLITKVHLTDILRYALVSAYGGAWIDSTVWLSDRIQDKLPDYLNRMYFTQRFPDWSHCPQEACRGKWCNFFFMGQKDCRLFSYVYESLIHWWDHHDRLIDYVIVDYVIWAGYCGIPEIQNTVDQVPLGNVNIWSMAKCLNDVYDPVKYQMLQTSNDFFKLSYKGNLNKQTPSGQKTVYAHILDDGI